MLNNKLPNKALTICPNPVGTKPVPYKNYIHNHSMGNIITMDGVNSTWYLMWYVWEFLGHLHYLSYDFDKFMFGIVENESPERPCKNDFTSYFNGMMNDSKSVYNGHIYTYFKIMWMRCNEDQEKWNTKLSNLRKAFNEYIQKRMADYEKDEKKVHPLFSKWKETLTKTYGENWYSYIWQCANFDELGEFIIECDKKFKKNENAKHMLCNLKLPEETYNMAGFTNQKVARIDEEGNIIIWTRAIKQGDKTYGYPATPDKWSKGGLGMVCNYTRHTSIFPERISAWINRCNELHIKVKFIVMEGDMNIDNYENDNIINNPGHIIICKNKTELNNKITSICKNTPAPNKPVGRKDESLVDFAKRYLIWQNS